jgi:hypothetical protein
MLGCTGGKVGGKCTGQGVDTLLIWSQDKFHSDPPYGPQPLGTQGKTINETPGGRVRAQETICYGVGNSMSAVTSHLPPI